MVTLLTSNIILTKGTALIWYNSKSQQTIFVRTYPWRQPLATYKRNLFSERSMWRSNKQKPKPQRMCKYPEEPGITSRCWRYTPSLAPESMPLSSLLHHRIAQAWRCYRRLHGRVQIWSSCTFRYHPSWIPYIVQMSLQYRYKPLDYSLKELYNHYTK